MSNDSETSHIVRNSLLGKIGLNVRGVIVLVLVITVSIIAATQHEIPERLFYLVSAAVGYYFGQQHNQKPTP